MSHVSEFRATVALWQADAAQLTDRDFDLIREYVGQDEEKRARRDWLKAHQAQLPPAPKPQPAAPAAHPDMPTDREVQVITSIIKAIGSEVLPMIKDQRLRADAQDVRIAQLENRIAELSAMIDLLSGAVPTS